ncbi:MAG: hypothetical protein U9Q15_03155 [Patescibacteria group bacterium]|nr:hypothetical protein [Patescibacteria group bacterium]
MYILVYACTKQIYKNKRNIHPLYFFILRTMRILCVGNPGFTKQIQKSLLLPSPLCSADPYLLPSRITNQETDILFLLVDQTNKDQVFELLLNRNPQHIAWGSICILLDPILSAYHPEFLSFGIEEVLLTKDLSNTPLMQARYQNLIRRTIQKRIYYKQTQKEINLHPETSSVSYQNHTLQLTPQQYAITAALIQSPSDNIYTEYIQQHIEDTTNTKQHIRSIDRSIARLRPKLFSISLQISAKRNGCYTVCKPYS